MFPRQAPVAPRQLPRGPTSEGTGPWSLSAALGAWVLVASLPWVVPLLL
jgi:hypothetical protein